MPPDTYKRKLITILSADVVGYSRLMADDEEATVKTLKTYRKVINSLISNHNGRLVDAPGDNMLAEFGSVVDALRCAWDIQQEIKSRNTDLPEDRRMTFRIGINLGDVIEEEGRIYGDGVNVAARLESLAEAGGISVSGAVYNHVENKAPFRFEDQGKQSVKNIEEPVQVYRVLMEHEVSKKKSASRWKRNVAVVIGVLILFLTGTGIFIWNTYFRIPDVEGLIGQKDELKLPDGPSIAVLPFDNLSNDPEQEYICDGLTETIITNLSFNPQLFVIARNSSFYFKGKSLKVQEVAKELGVQYVLEGSIQKSKNRVRINSQLVDAKTGHHLWAAKYDRELKDIFIIQDEIAEKIFTELAVKLTDGEVAKVFTKYPANLKFNLLLMKALLNIKSANPKNNILARRQAEQAMELFPKHPIPYSIIANSYLHDLAFKPQISPLTSLVQATKYAKLTIDIDENNPDAYIVLSGISLFRGNHDKAIALAERAIELNPNYDAAYAALGLISNFAGIPENGIDFLKKAIRLNPIPPHLYYVHLGNSYRMLGQYKAAITILKRAIDLEPESDFGHIILALTYSLSGQDEKARKEIEELYRVNPSFSSDRFKILPYKDNAEKERINQVYQVWHKAGLMD